MSEVAVDKSSESQTWLLEDTIACAAIAMACMVLGLYACSLNHTLYTHKAPFYDSLAYNQAMAETMAESKNLGLFPALRDGMKESTVYIPTIVSALIGPFAKPQRDIGIWIQIAELVLLSVSLYFLLRRVLHASVLLSACLVLPMLSLKCYYQVIGGLSDFRMDLSLMLMFGVTCVWYLIASATHRISHFLVLGVVAGIAILFRATAPVYLGIALGPCVLLDLMNSSQRVRFGGRLVLSALIAMLVGGWFLIVNYKYLYFYYVVWNIDAQAKLPLSQAMMHVEFMADHVGNKLFLVLGLLMVFSIGMRQWVRPKGLVDLNSKNEFFPLTLSRQICLVWFAVSPAAMLVFKGAGPNRFVSMPSSLGIVLVAILYLGRLLAIRSSRKIELVLFVLLGFFVLVQAHSGLAFHAPGVTSPMNGHKLVIQAMVADAKVSNMKQVRYGVSYCAEMTVLSLRNIMTFDMNFDGSDLKLGDFVTDASMSRYAPAEWDTVAGDTMEAKIRSLAVSVESTVDYLILPEPETVDFLTTRLPHVVCDKYAGEIRKQLLESPVWVPISGVIEIVPEEKVRVFKNMSKK
jgi:hypothetical protein